MKNRLTLTTLVAAAILVTTVSCKGDKSKSGETSTETTAVSQEEAVVVSAVKLLADYEADETAADKLYKGKTLIVSGEVLDREAQHDNTSYVLINSPESSIGSVRCEFAAEHMATTLQLQRDQQTTITGICEGMDEVQVVLKNSAMY